MMKRKTNRKKADILLLEQHGYILVDALVAIVFITVALVAISGMLVHSVKSIASSANETVAVNLAQKQLELLRSRDSKFWLDHANTAINWQDISEIEPIIINNVEYRVSTTAKESMDDTGNPKSLVDVAVTVEWQENGRERTIGLTTCYSKLPFYRAW